MDMPCNLALEKSVLGCALIYPKIIDTCKLTPDDFYFQKTYIIFNKLADLYRKNIDPSPAAIWETLSKHDRDIVGEFSFYGELIISAPDFIGCHIENEIKFSDAKTEWNAFKELVKRLKKIAELRKAIYKAHLLSQQVYEAGIIYHG